MSSRLEDKVVLVTGAGTKGEGIGNGKAAAVQFAREGAKVFCSDLDEAAAQATADMIKEEGGVVEVCSVDITKVKDCKNAVETCLSRFGKLDHLYNNVGISLGAEIVDATEENWDTTFEVNAKGIFLMCRQAIPVMKEAKFGSI